MVWYGTAGRGKAVMVWCGGAWQGGHGSIRLGTAGRGKVVTARQGAVWYGAARFGGQGGQGVVRRVWVGLGRAR